MTPRHGFDADTDRQLRSDVDQDSAPLATYITLSSPLISGGLQLSELFTGVLKTVERNLK
jgi:hypothetical protein